MVTAADVWDALAEIPDPEIPVVSLVDLGVVRDVAVEDGRVRVDFTPTFLGCPALEVMRDAIDELDDFVDELGRTYHRVDGYSLKAKLKEARERAAARAG